HGAALYIHHSWAGWEERVQSPFPQIKDHILLPAAGDLRAADERLRPHVTPEVLRAAVASIPDVWLAGDAQFATVAAHRERYVTYLDARLNGPRAWLQEAIDARERGPERYQPRLTHRVV
ncbi:MAG TPA: aminotransferase class I and II, partial [Chloroflexi bacterium]|nr:aminotransferase class I and II [Chloroflexota bacterium]